MKNRKITRLMLGLVILFSFFIFQGSDDHHGGCTQCEKESSGGTLSVINRSFFPMQVRVDPLGGNKVVNIGENKLFALDEGVYQVVALKIFSLSENTDDPVYGVRVIEIKQGSIKTITFGDRKK